MESFWDNTLVETPSNGHITCSNVHVLYKIHGIFYQEFTVNSVSILLQTYIKYCTCTATFAGNKLSVK